MVKIKAERRKSIFNWNHISKDLSEDQVKQLKEYYEVYHKRYGGSNKPIKATKRRNT